MIENILANLKIERLNPMQEASINAWKEGKGIVGIFVHHLKDFNGEQSIKGNNPFKLFYIDRTYNYIAERLFLEMRL